MAGTFLSDEVINSTELRRKQSYWLNTAHTNPVSITSGNKKLVLINRDLARNMYLFNYYAKMIIEFCQEQHTGVTKSAVFPWIEHLDEDEIKEFTDELLVTFQEAVQCEKWGNFEAMLKAWIDTAVAKTNPEIMELVNPKGRSREYARLKK